VVTAVIFHFGHVALLWFAIIRTKVPEDVVVLRWSVAGSDSTVSALAAGLAVECAASATPTFADVQRDFVSEPHWLKALVAVKLRPAISGVVFVGDVRPVT
jgi:hypothetical protein